MGWMRRRDSSSDIMPSTEWQDVYFYSRHDYGDAAVLGDIYERLLRDANDPASGSESREASSFARKELRKQVRRQCRSRRRDIKSIKHIIAAWESENGALTPEARIDAWRKLGLPIMGQDDLSPSEA